MTQFDYFAKPPFPKSKDDEPYVCYLEIIDFNKRIDFKVEGGLYLWSNIRLQELKWDR